MLEQLISLKPKEKQIEGERLTDTNFKPQPSFANMYFPSGVAISNNGQRVAMSHGTISAPNYAGFYVFDQVIVGGKPTLEQKSRNILVPGVAFENNSNSGLYISMDAEGDQLVVGAPNANNGGAGSPGPGGILIYKRENDATWTLALKQVSPSPIADGRFGTYSVFSPDGTLLAVGAPNENSKFGRVYIFKRDGGGNWVSDTFINNPNSDADSLFGQNMIWSKDSQNLFISSPVRNIVTWFIRTGNSFTMKQAITMPAVDVVSGAAFGQSIAVSIDRSYLVIGAPGRTITAGESGGYVYLYKLENDIYVQKDLLTGAMGTDKTIGFGDNCDIDHTNSYILISSYRGAAGWVNKFTLGADDTLTSAWRKTYGGSITQHGIAMAKEAAFWVLGDIGKSTVVYGR